MKLYTVPPYLWVHILILVESYKRVLGVPKNKSNTLIFHITRYGNNIDQQQIEKYRNLVEEKNMKFTVDNYTDRPIFKSNTWKSDCQKNRHLLARYTVDTWISP